MIDDPAVTRRSPQLHELLNAATAQVFFIHDQGVRPNEIGSSAYIRNEAHALGAAVSEDELEVQFCCAGSDGFVNARPRAIPPAPRRATDPGRIDHTRCVGRSAWKTLSFVDGSRWTYESPARDRFRLTGSIGERPSYDAVVTVMFST